MRIDKNLSDKDLKSAPLEGEEWDWLDRQYFENVNKEEKEELLPLFPTLGREDVKC